MTVTGPWSYESINYWGESTPVAEDEDYGAETVTYHDNGTASVDTVTNADGGLTLRANTDPTRLDKLWFDVRKMVAGFDFF